MTTARHSRVYVLPVARRSLPMLCRLNPAALTNRSPSPWRSSFPRTTSTDIGKPCSTLRLCVSGRGKLYAERGRPRIDPIVFFKPQLVMFFEGLRSERKLVETVSLNLPL